MALFNPANIERQEVKGYCVENEESHRKGYKIVEYTKTRESTRSVVAVSKAKEYLDIIVKYNRKKGFNNDFLLLNKNGNRLHEFSINNALRRVNEKIQTEQKANHCLRKTCLSNLAESDKKDAFEQALCKSVTNVTKK